jgi:hypothetical protein
MLLRLQLDLVQALDRYAHAEHHLEGDREQQQCARRAPFRRRSRTTTATCPSFLAAAICSSSTDMRTPSTISKAIANNNRCRHGTDMRTPSTISIVGCCHLSGL